MKIKHHIEQATAAFKERQGDWSRLDAYSIEVLELVERTSNLKDAERTVLQEYLLFRKRKLKIELEVMERAADYVERAALPVAVTSFSVVNWLLIELQASDGWRSVVQVLAFVSAVATWYGMRTLAFRRTTKARRQLAKLGRVD